MQLNYLNISNLPGLQPRSPLHAFYYNANLKGFNGMEKDDEVKGSGGSHYTTPFRQYDPRIGRWMSLDPITHPQYSPYSAFDNNPIFYADPSGADSEGGLGEPKEGDTRVNNGQKQYYTNKKEWVNVTDDMVSEFLDPSCKYKTFSAYYYAEHYSKADASNNLLTSNYGFVYDQAKNQIDNYVFDPGTYRDPILAKSAEPEYNKEPVKLKDTYYGKYVLSNIEFAKESYDNYNQWKKDGKPKRPVTDESGLKQDKYTPLAPPEQFEIGYYFPSSSVYSTVTKKYEWNEDGTFTVTGWQVDIDGASYIWTNQDLHKIVANALNPHLRCPVCDELLIELMIDIKIKLSQGKEIQPSLLRIYEKYKSNELFNPKSSGRE